MGMVYYTSVAPNKEAVICGGLVESAIKFIQNTDYHKNVQIGSYRESFINSLKTAFEKALNKFDEDSISNDTCVVDTFYYIHCNCKAELIYINVSEPFFKHYYIRFELFQ